MPFSEKLLERIRNNDPELIELILPDDKNSKLSSELGLSTPIWQADGYVLAKALLTNNSLQYMDLEKNYSGHIGDSIIAILKALKGNKSLRALKVQGDESLDVSLLLPLLKETNILWFDCGLRRYSEFDIVPSIKKYDDIIPKGRFFKIDWVRIKDVKRFLLALETDDNITHLELTGQRIADEHSTQLASVLKNNNTLKALGLHGCKLGNVGLAQIVPALKENRTLSRLDLGFNQITDASQEMLTDLFLTNRTIESLCLSDQLKNVVTLMQVLEASAIRELSFYQADNLNEASILAIAQFLEKNKKCEILNLDGVNLWSKEQTLFNALKVNTSLVAIKLRDYQLSSDSLSILAACIATNKTLKKIQLWNTIIFNKSGAIYLIANALAKNTTLEEINLGYSRLSLYELVALKNAIKRNSTLRRINLENLIIIEYQKYSINCSEAERIANYIIKEINTLLKRSENDNSESELTIGLRNHINSEKISVFFIRTLVRLGANANITTEEGDSLVYVVASDKSKDPAIDAIIGELVREHRVDINHLNKKGHTALRKLMETEFDAVTALTLVRLGADPNTTLVRLDKIHSLIDLIDAQNKYIANKMVIVELKKDCKAEHVNKIKKSLSKHEYQKNISDCKEPLTLVTLINEAYSEGILSDVLGELNWLDKLSVKKNEIPPLSEIRHLEIIITIWKNLEAKKRFSFEQQIFISALLAPKKSEILAAALAEINKPDDNSKQNKTEVSQRRAGELGRFIVKLEADITEEYYKATIEKNVASFVNLATEGNPALFETLLLWELTILDPLTKREGPYKELKALTIALLAEERRWFYMDMVYHPDMAIFFYYHEHCFDAINDMLKKIKKVPISKVVMEQRIHFKRVPAKLSSADNLNIDENVNEVSSVPINDSTNGSSVRFPVRLENIVIKKLIKTELTLLEIFYHYLPNFQGLVNISVQEMGHSDFKQFSQLIWSSQYCDPIAARANIFKLLTCALKKMSGSLSDQARDSSMVEFSVASTNKSIFVHYSELMIIFMPQESVNLQQIGIAMLRDFEQELQNFAGFSSENGQKFLESMRSIVNKPPKKNILFWKKSITDFQQAILQLAAALSECKVLLLGSCQSQASTRSNQENNFN